ncbi:MAG: hypothetical protein CMK07_06795 [Ponticaulis sp.]|nr:hypothetical protein [Ponticaulis sp.]
MAKIINLGQARKQKKREEKERIADVNRAKFGQTKAEKSQTSTETRRQNSVLDGAKRSRDDD